MWAENLPEGGAKVGFAIPALKKGAVAELIRLCEKANIPPAVAGEGITSSSLPSNIGLTDIYGNTTKVV